jgi:hypothetical protein
MPCFIFKTMENTNSVVDIAILNEAKTDITPRKNIKYTITDYIPFGSDNLFPQAMALFARMSPNHRGVINSKKKYFAGRNLETKDTEFQKVLDSCNLQGESLQDVLGKYILDYQVGGNSYLEIITATNGSFIFFNHIDFTKCRKSKDEQKILVNPDWSEVGLNDDETKELSIYPVFTPDKDKPSILRSVYHMYDYEPEFYYYGLPSWISGKDSVQIDIKTNRFNLGRLINTFKLSGIMFVPVKDKGESDQILSLIKNHHTGDLNQDKLLVLTKSRSSELEKGESVQLIQNQYEEAGSWLNLHQMNVSDIITAHSWYRALCSLADNTGFDTNRILNEYEVALSSDIAPMQERIKKQIVKIYKEVTKKDIDFEFINRSPVSDNNGLYLWEYRKNKGLPYDENDLKQQKIIYNGVLID